MIITAWEILIFIAGIAIGLLIAVVAVMLGIESGLKSYRR